MAFTPQTGMTSAPVAGLHYAISGRGPLILLAHEMGGSLHSFDALAALLEDRFTVLRYDLRGHGQSLKARDGYDLQGQIADAQSVLHAAGHSGPFWLLSVAAASPMAVTFALQNPLIQGLILCSAAIAMDEKRGAALCARADEAVAHGMRAVTESTFARSYPPEIRQDTAAFNTYVERFESLDPACYAMTVKALASSRTAESATRLRCPALCLAGSHDQVRPPAIIRELAAGIPGGEFAELAGAHLLPYQNPEAVAQAVTAFIKRHAKD